ncbi:MAG: hypothetical protein AB1743_03120 [Actinomycetota bacterium]
MKGMIELVRRLPNKLRLVVQLPFSKWKIENVCRRNLKSHLKSADSLLMDEYFALTKALEQEKDPKERQKIMDCISKVEAIMEKRRKLGKILSFSKHFI